MKETCGAEWAQASHINSSRLTRIESGNRAALQRQGVGLCYQRVLREYVLFIKGTGQSGPKASYIGSSRLTRIESRNLPVRQRQGIYFRAQRVFRE